MPLSIVGTYQSQSTASTLPIFKALVSSPESSHLVLRLLSLINCINGGEFISKRKRTGSRGGLRGGTSTDVEGRGFGSCNTCHQHGNLEYHEVMTLIKCKHAEHVAKKSLVDPRSLMVLDNQQREKISAELN